MKQEEAFALGGDAGEDGAASVKVDVLTVTLLMASILYAFCLVMAERKLVALLQIRPELSIKKLLVLSISVVCAVRIMTILGVAAMNMANVRAHYSLQPISRQTSTEIVDRNQEFYDNAMTVLFDLPNCVVVSTYVLLTLVWAECFMESRFHNESVVQWKRMWLQAYTIFTTVLFGSQLVLYTSIFLASGHVLRTILYAAITSINFTAVSLVLILYINLNLRFSVSHFFLASIICLQSMVLTIVRCRVSHSAHRTLDTHFARYRQS